MGMLQGCRAAIQQGGAKALVKLPGNLGYAPAADLLRVLGEGDSAVARRPQIEIPEMIDNPRLPFRVMKGVVTGRQIAQLVEAGYEIRGYNDNKLKDVIADESNAGKGIGYISLLDGRALAKELNRQNPGRKFRVPTDKELKKLNRLVEDQISGFDYFWIWTETKYDNKTFVVRFLDQSLSEGDARQNKAPDYRECGGAVCLVEDR
ncbi:MAG: hypothetical protein ABIH22_02560 [Candidatus Margulisiibacteriota bacterium]